MEETIKLIIKKAKKKIQHLDTERILLYTIDSSGHIISGRNISKNNQAGYSYLDSKKFYEMVDREIVYYAVLIHNHPGSTMATSDDDDEITTYINNYCKENAITLYDHIIIMRNSDEVYSYRKNHKIIKDIQKPKVVIRKKEL